MGMRPIDIQISIPRATEAGRVAQGDQQQNQLRQQEVANQAQVQTDNFENTVRHTEQSEAKKVKEQKEREKKKQQQSNKKEAGSGTEDEKTSAPAGSQARGAGGKLDILA